MNIKVWYNILLWTFLVNMAWYNIPMGFQRPYKGCGRDISCIQFVHSMETHLCSRHLPEIVANLLQDWCFYHHWLASRLQILRIPNASRAILTCISFMWWEGPRSTCTIVSIDDNYDWTTKVRILECFHQSVLDHLLVSNYVYIHIACNTNGSQFSVSAW